MTNAVEYKTKPLTAKSNPVTTDKIISWLSYSKAVYLYAKIFLLYSFIERKWEKLILDFNTSVLQGAWLWLTKAKNY